ncbi:MAG: tetratricopeptide repeat protein [Candidatus Staskawiczbacteria bacterium]|nr:tetratricopeptide repeat protein [Candidatus Staskawiczbacteria bacterium]
MDLQKLLNQAWETKKAGNLQQALNLYNQAFDILISEATQYAHNSGNTTIDDGATRKILPSHFSKSKEYLKKDKVAAIISNNMGTIFAELKDYENAEKFFHQSIDLTPNGEKYKDPYIALEEIKK